MANETNYIGVAMGLDVEDLKQGLAEASKRIGEANADFRAASSEMENWQQSIDGVRAKVTQLDSVLAAQQSKLAGLRAEYEKVAAEQGENSTAARNLYIRMQNQVAVVNQTQRELNNYRKTLQQAEAGTIDLTQVTLRAGRAIQSAGDDAKETSKVIGLLGKSLLTIGGIVTGLVGGFLALGESTREFREDQAKLTSAFEASKLSADSASETYKKLYGAIGESDTAVEASQQIALLANSEEEAAKWAELATGVVGKFGDALKAETFYEAANETIKLGEATGAYTQMLEQSGYNVEEFNAGLAALNTEEEKQAYMLEISNQLLSEAGEAYNETAKDIIEAREAEAELSKTTAELGATAEPILTEVKNGWNEVLKVILELLKGADFEAIKQGISNAFDTFINKILPAIIDGFTWFIDNIGIITGLIVGLGSALLTLNVVKMVNGIVKAFKAWTLATEGMTVAQKLLNLAMKANPIGIVISLIAGIVGAVITLWNTSEKFRTFWTNLWQGIKDTFAGIKDSFVNVGKNIVEGIWNGIKNASNWIKDKISGFASNVAGWFKKTFKIKSPSKLMADEVGLYIGEGVGEGIINSLPYVKKDLSKFSNFVTDNLGGIKSGLAVSGVGGVRGRSFGGINSVQNIYYNGNLSRKQVKQLEDDNYTSIKMKLKTEGLI